MEERMGSGLTYQELELQAANAAIAKGHNDPANLRYMLIWTKSKSTAPAINAYFAAHQHDTTLVRALIAIASNGEIGDAPWAAANILASFSASTLVPFIAELQEIIEHDWEHLCRPDTAVLDKAAA
jgi:hypothetical protein